MATILTKKKDSSGIPATADLTNSTGGAELAINTADKRLYTKNSSNVIVEVGVNPATLDISGAVSAGSTFGITGNTSAKGTFSVIGAVSAGSTLGVTGDASVTGTLLVRDEFTFATANTTGTLDVLSNTSVGGTLLVTGGASDADGNLRDIPRGYGNIAITQSTYSAAITDIGNHLLLVSSDQTVVIPSTANAVFGIGDIFTIVNSGASANSTTNISSNMTSMFRSGEASATATIAIATNGVASVLFVSASHAFVTGNVS